MREVAYLMRPGFHRHRGNQGGQALVEASLSILVFTLLTMGMIEFGRAWMVANMITQAARDGARSASVAPPNTRDSAGIITNSTFLSNLRTQVKSQIGNVLDSTSTNAFAVTVSQPTTGGGVPEVQVTVTGSVPYIFNMPLVGTNFSVNRVVTFRDEGR